MKKTKKMIAVLLAATMMMNLSACSSFGKEEAPAQTTAQTTAQASEAAQAAQTEAAAAAKAADASETADYVDYVVVALKSGLGDFSPFGGASGSRNVTKHLLYDYLAVAEDAGCEVEELQGEIAKSITMTDNVTCEVELYDYVHDNKGNAITADDVVACYEYAATQGDFDAVSSYLESITAIDEYKVKIVTNTNGIGVMMQVLTNVPIVNWSWFQSASDDEKNTDPAVTGPYKIKELVDGSHISVETVDGYWQTDESLCSYLQVQSVGEINFRVMKESSMRTIALQNKEIDIGMAIAASDMANFRGADGSALDGYTLYSAYNCMVDVFMFNCSSNSVFADQALRQAVLYAIDFESVRLGAGNDVNDGRIVKDFSPADCSDYNPAWADEDYYDYNPDKAKELLSAAGYKNGEVSVRLMLQNSTTNVAAATVIQAYLSEVGINCELLPYDQALFNTYKFDDTQWDIIMDGKSSASGFVTDCWAMCLDSRKGTANFVEDPHLQELLVTAQEDHSEASVNAFHDYLKEMAYGVGMYQNYSYFVAQDGILSLDMVAGAALSVTSSTYASDYSSVAN